MKYEEYEGKMEELIGQKLQEIEKKEQIKILHAVESGSRSWGFASPDSDFDVRFIYVHPMEYYLRLQEEKDFISWELNEVLDIVGWDLFRVLRYAHKSNATVFEWSASPVVYDTTEIWEQIRDVIRGYFSEKSCMYHYYGTARKNAMEHLQGEQVSYKKYFYVLRPLLSCKWIEERSCPPPVLFSELQEAVLEEDLRPAVQSLLEQKARMLESDKGERIEALDVYIEQKLRRYKELADSLPDDRDGDWEKLNEVFLKVLQRKQ